MQEWTKKSLREDGIRDDSVFFEYIGRITELENLAGQILEKSKGRLSFESKASDILDLVSAIHDIRFTHFTTLVEKDAVVDITETLSNGERYVNAVQNIDKEIEDGLNELKFCLNNNRDIDAMRVFDQTKTKLQRLKSMDQYLYERANDRINKTFDKVSSAIPPKYQSYTTVDNPYSQPVQNVNYLGFRPSQGVPDHRTAYVQRLQPIRTVAPQPVKPQYNYDVTMQPPQAIPPMQPHRRPVMHQNGPSQIPVRNRKKEKENRKKENKKEPNKIKKLVIRTVSTAVCIGGLVFLLQPGQTVNTPTQPTPSIPTQEPTVMQPGTMPSVTENPIFITPTVETPETKPTVTATPSVAQETHQKYDKHSLMYCLEFMDDELVSVVADSLRNSIDNRTAVQISMYGNGCNMTFSTDREYVAHVFGILDSRAKDMRYYGNSPDRFAIAPQMEQLSGDVSKYLIAKAIRESGKYNKDNYSIDDIDYYYSISGGTTKSFDARTVKTKNGKLVEDELVGRSVHFSGDLKTLLNAHCTLNAAIEGSGTKDLLTGNYTLCAFGTQEGTVINDTSIDAYNALVNIFQSEYELKVTAPGKGVKIVYDKDLER